MTSPNTGGRRRVAVHEVPQLFSSPYWYEGLFQLPSDTYRLEIPQQDAFVMVGTPYLTLLPVELSARLSSAVGTAIASHWIAATGVVIDLEPFLPDGDRGVRIKESLRSSDTDTPADEFDDASDWFEG